MAHKEYYDMKGKGNRGMEATVATSSKAEYPYGIRVNLDDESIEKLGLDFNKFKSGESVKLICEAIVVSRTESEYEGKMTRDLSFQITGMKKPTMIPEDRMKTGTELIRSMRRNKA